MNHREFKHRINEQFTLIAKAVSSPSRFELLDLLAQGERSVEELALESELSVANTSQHLQALRKAALVVSRKDGLQVFYRLADPDVFRLLEIIREIAAKQLAEVDRLVQTYFTNRKVLESISLAELMERLDDPDLVVLDVRPQLEYQQGHIAGARSIPIAELATRLQEISPTQRIVAYCRGSYCVFADEAVDLLTAQGYQANRLEQGYPEWALAGLPTEA